MRLAPFGAPPPDDQPSPRGARTWQLHDFSIEQIQKLVPSATIPADPRAPRDAYWFFDRDKRPTVRAQLPPRILSPDRGPRVSETTRGQLDNEKLYTEARKDLSRPKLSTMQKRAIDELWELATPEERAQYEDAAEGDTERYEEEVAVRPPFGRPARIPPPSRLSRPARCQANKVEHEALQTAAAEAELSEFLADLDLQAWEERIRSIGFSSVASMRASLKQGRWAFLGQLEVGRRVHPPTL